MSVEAPMGGISAPTIPAPAVSAAPAMEGSLATLGPSISTFEGFRAFSASPAAVREGPIASNIFSEDFSVVAQRSPGVQASEKAPSPNIDGLLGTQKFTPQPVTVNEGSAPLDFSATQVIWQREEIPVIPSVEQTKPENIISQEVETAVYIKKEAQSLADNLVKKVEKEYAEAEVVQAVKVKKLFEEIGISSEKANHIVSKVVEEKGITMENSLEEISQTEVQKIPDEGEQLNGRPKEKEVEVDENAQNARLEAVKNTVTELQPDDQISGVDIAKALSQTEDKKSEILSQIGLPEEDDGSLKEAVKQISKIDTQDVESVVREAQKVLEDNRAVRITDSAKQSVEKKEVEKVIYNVLPKLIIPVET